MKRLSVILRLMTVSVMAFSLTSCNVLKRLNNRVDYDTLQKQQTQAVCDAIQNGDAQALRVLFAEDVSEAAGDLDEKIDRLLKLLDGGAVDIQTPLKSQNEQRNGKVKTVNGTSEIAFTTLDTVYYLSLNFRLADSEHPKKNGLRSLTVCTEEEKPYVGFTYLHSTGINLFSLYEPWYDVNVLSEGTMYMDNELVSCEPPVLFAKLELYPLLSLLDAVGASYTQQATGEIDVEYQGRHWQFTFPESNLENYQWIALSDVDNGQDLRLSNTEIYHGLYTVINGNIYLSRSAGSYLCGHLAFLPQVDYEEKSLILINNSHA